MSKMSRGSMRDVARASTLLNLRCVSQREKYVWQSHTCSASLTPPAVRAPRRMPVRPGWAENGSRGQLALIWRSARLSSVRNDQRKEQEDLRIRSSLGSPLRLDGRRAARKRVERSPEARRTRQDDAGYGLRSCFGALVYVSSAGFLHPRMGEDRR